MSEASTACETAQPDKRERVWIHRCLARRDALEPLTGEVEAFCQNRNLPGQIRHAMGLGVEEAFMNIVEHGTGRDEPVHVELALWTTEHALAAELRDDGPPFDPLRASLDYPWQPASEQQGTQGLGLHLIRKLMDVLTYWREEPWNCLRLEKAIPGDSGEAH